MPIQAPGLQNLAEGSDQSPEWARVLAQVLPMLIPTGASGAALQMNPAQPQPESGWGQILSILPLLLGAAGMMGKGRATQEYGKPLTNSLREYMMQKYGPGMKETNEALKTGVDPSTKGKLEATFEELMVGRDKRTPFKSTELPEGKMATPSKPPIDAILPRPISDFSDQYYAKAGGDFNRVYSINNLKPRGNALAIGQEMPLSEGGRPSIDNVRHFILDTNDPYKPYYVFKEYPSRNYSELISSHKEIGEALSAAKYYVQRHNVGESIEPRFDLFNR